MLMHIYIHTKSLLPFTRGVTMTLIDPSIDSYVQRNKWDLS